VSGYAGVCDCDWVWGGDRGREETGPGEESSVKGGEGPSREEEGEPSR
jgi:hypothetical protein